MLTRAGVINKWIQAARDAEFDGPYRSCTIEMQTAIVIAASNEWAALVQTRGGFGESLEQ